MICPRSLQPCSISSPMRSTPMALRSTFPENGGFKLRAISHGLEHDYVPEFVPYGVGIPTYVLRQGRSCRLTVIRADEAGAGARSGSFYDIDARSHARCATHFMPPYKTLIAVPVFFGTQVLGVIEPWLEAPHHPARVRRQRHRGCVRVPLHRAHEPCREHAVASDLGAPALS